MSITIEVPQDLEQAVRVAAEVQGKSVEDLMRGLVESAFAPGLVRVDRQKRPYGLCAGEFTVPSNFDAPLPEDVLALFEGK